MNNYRMTIKVKMGAITKMVVEFTADNGRDATAWCRWFLNQQGLFLNDSDWDLDEFAPGMSGSVSK